MTKQERTKILLAREHGKPYEFQRLHAILCLDHGFENETGGVFFGISDAVDLVAVAARLDEILEKMGITA